MNDEKTNKIMSSEELDDVLPKYEPIKLSGKNLAQNYVSAFNTGMNIYQCVNYLQGNIDWTIKAVNDVVKSWNDSVDETLAKSIEITKETTTDQFNKEWTDKQPELIEQVNTLTTNQFNNEKSVFNDELDTLNARMDTFTKLPEGSTTGDAELKDIRVGANGTTYDTAGNAVRGQYSQLKEDLDNETARATNRENEIESLFTMPTQEAVNKWLTDHPEATTTVQDKSLDVSKLTDNAKLYLYKDYVTPEMFGAKGDGVTDDTNSIIKAIDTEKPVIFDTKKTYLITDGLITAKNNIFLNNTTILVKPTGDIEYIFKMQKGYELSGGTIKVVETSHKVGGLLCGACKIRNINLVNLTYHGVKNTEDCYYNVFENIKIWHSVGSTNYIDGHNIDFGSSPVPNCCTFIGCMLNGKSTGSKIKLSGSANRFIGCDSSFGSDSNYNDVILELIGDGNDLALYIEGTSNDCPFIIISGNTNKLNISGMLQNRAKEKVLTDTGVLNEINFIHHGNNNYINIKSFPRTIDFEGKYGVIASPYNSEKSYAVINDYRITNISNIGNINQTTEADNYGFTITGEDENTTCSTCTFNINQEEMAKGYIDFDVTAYSTFKSNGIQYTSNGEKVHVKLVGVGNFSVYQAYKYVRVENISITYLA